MRVKDYLEKIKKYDKVTFLVANAIKDENCPGYHAEYANTAICFASDLLKSKCSLLNMIILNDKQPPIDWLSGAKWIPAYNAGHLKCLLVISEEDLELIYPTQAEHMEAYIETQMTTL